MENNKTIEKKPRQSKEETSHRLITTAIELMKTTPIAELSSLKICATAGLDKMTVRYCFGSHAQLLLATARHLAQGIAPHVVKGVVGSASRSDEKAVLFGRLAAFLFASYGDQIPQDFSPSEENVTILAIYQQLQETYGFSPDLALLLTKRSVLVAVASAGLGSMIPVSDAEAKLLNIIQERTYEFLASIQDELALPASD